jgi:hypothetical protein
MRWRQTFVYTLLVGVVAVVGVMALGMWNGQLAAVLQTGFKVNATEEPNLRAVPCPSSPNARYPDPSAVEARVLNGGGQSGYAAAAAKVLAAQGFPEPSAGNTSPYAGLLQLVTGVKGVDSAYTLLQFSPEGSVIVLDGREDATVDVVLGAAYTQLRTPDEIDYEPGGQIVALERCRAAEDLLEELPTTAASASSSASPSGAATE